MPNRMVFMRIGLLVVVALLSATLGRALRADGLTSVDLYALKSVEDVQASPDGKRVVYRVKLADKPGAPHSETFLLDLATGASTRLDSDDRWVSGVRWSPNGRRLAYFGRLSGNTGLVVADADGSGATFIAPVQGTNHPLPSTGERLAWSPDGNNIAFVSATTGPEPDTNGDPIVIHKYLYKPAESPGSTRFNDNRRLHIFVVNLATRKVKQLTDGPFYEHSIDWSPKGEEIAFLSNVQSNADRVFNYDIFAVRVADGTVRRLTHTPSVEYQPHWSPNGKSLAFLATTRPLTSSETTMEDTHVHVMDSEGRNRRDVGAQIDNRQSAVAWAPDGRTLFTSVQQKGNVALYRLGLRGGRPRGVIDVPGIVSSWSVGKAGVIAFAFASRNDPGELYAIGPVHVGTSAGSLGRRLTTLNDLVLSGKTLGAVESVTFESFDGRAVEGFLTRPVGVDPSRKYPLIVTIHGGPHSQQGVAFNNKAQIYAAHGWATLTVNYRGSVGYGQEHADAIFNDQNGGDARDVLAGVDAALARYPWLDGEQMGIEGGSYGGQLTNWIITQTDRFKAAIPISGISNLVSFNYLSFYHDYLAVEFGAFPHENGVIDRLWERSPIRYARLVKTPTLLIHGANDNDVPVAEAEQFYIALQDVGVEATLAIYPREGHEIREMKHVADIVDRSIDWYARHFQKAPPNSSP